MGNKRKIIPIFIPQDSCKHSCIYCNQPAVVGRKKPYKPEEIAELIHKSLTTIKPTQFGNKPSIEVAFYGGSFTELPHVLQKAYLEAAIEAMKGEDFHGIRISTRPDSINLQILKLLKKYNVVMVELGVQSMDDEVLHKINRGHSAKDVVKATRLLQSYGFNVGHQLMIGLPGENKESLKMTAEQVLFLSPHTVRIHPTLVIKDTALAQLYTAGHYTPLELDEAINICKKLVVQFENGGIKVIRIGLQGTISLENRGTILAGPYHPAFGQMVRGAIFLDALVAVLDKMKIISKSIIIRVFPSNLSYIYGLKKANIQYLQHRYGLNDVQVETDSNLKEDIISLECNNTSVLSSTRMLPYIA
jgi:histone acetyltransferase (RNA polymerase elongator complex component)